MKKILLTAFLFTFLLASNLNNLLNKLSIKDDLSNKTKKENAGYVIVYTRQDLDRMKILSLKEILQRIPFIRYDENNFALTDPFYAPYQLNNPTYIRFYLNDIELNLPYGSNILQLLGQLDVKYIDHIEIYMGLPSFEVSPKPSMTVIKIYTKKGYRENNSIIETLFGNRGLNEEYFTSGYGDETKSYFLYFGNDNIKRKNYTHNNFSLKRNIFSKSFLGNIQYKNFEILIYRNQGKKDTFIADGFKISPLNPYIKHFYNLINIEYKKGSLKIESNYQFSNIFYYNKNAYIINYNPLIGFYNQHSLHLHEKTINFKISKKFIFNTNTLFLEFLTKNDKFNIENEKINNKPVNIKYLFTKRHSNIYGVEYTKTINQKNLINISYTKLIQINKNTKNYSSNIYRIGYIHNNNNYIFKSFIFKGDFLPTPLMLNYNSNLNKVKTFAYSFKIKKLDKYGFTSLLFGHTNIKNFIAFTKNGLVNLKKENNYDSISIRKEINLYKDKIIINPWRLWANYKSYNIKNIQDGIIFSLFKTINSFNTYSSLVFYKNHKQNNEGINLDLTISKSYKNFEIYFKGINLLNKDVTTDYYLINPLTNKKDIIKNIDVNERIIAIGVSCEF